MFSKILLFFLYLCYSILRVRIGGEIMNMDKENSDKELLDISSDKDLVKVADEVAFEILHPETDNNRRFLFLLLLFIVFLTSIISFVCFSMADRFNSIRNNTITTGSVLFSFSDGSNYINMIDVYPVSDEAGMKLNGSNELYEFNVSEKYYGDSSKKKRSDYSNYEVSLILNDENTIAPNYIKIYLIKNQEEVKINNRIINRISELPKSKVQNNGYTLIRNEITDDNFDTYTFRMWLSTDYKVDNVSRVFKCKIVVNSY